MIVSYLDNFFKFFFENIYLFFFKNNFFTYMKYINFTFIGMINSTEFSSCDCSKKIKIHIIYIKYFESKIFLSTLR